MATEENSKDEAVEEEESAEDVEPEEESQDRESKPDIEADASSETKNVMQEPVLNKVVVNIGVGEAGEKVARASSLLESLTGQRPVRIAAKRTNRDFGIRKGATIGCKVTLRNDKARNFLEKAFSAVGDELKSKSFDDEGNFAFGIDEHINISGVKYDPSIGIYGMDVCVNVEKRGYRVKRRKIRKKKIPSHHRVTRKETIDFIQREFDVRVE